MTEDLIMTRENYLTLLNLLNSTDKENQELFTSFYKKICIKENSIFLLLLVKESRQGVKHFRDNYPDLFSCLPSINADISKLNVFSYGTIQDYLKFHFVSKESCHFFCELYTRHYLKEITPAFDQIVDEINISYKEVPKKEEESVSYKGLSR